MRSSALRSRVRRFESCWGRIVISQDIEDTPNPVADVLEDADWSNLGRGSWRQEQHEVVAVVEPGLMKDVLHVSCGRPPQFPFAGGHRADANAGRYWSTATWTTPSGMRGSSTSARPTRTRVGIGRVNAVVLAAGRAPQGRGQRHLPC
jgi:hypothetical protein